MWQSHPLMFGFPLQTASNCTQYYSIFIEGSLPMKILPRHHEAIPHTLYFPTITKTFDHDYQAVTYLLEVRVLIYLLTMVYKLELCKMIFFSLSSSRTWLALRSKRVYPRLLLYCFRIDTCSTGFYDLHESNIIPHHLCLNHDIHEIQIMTKNLRQ